MNENKKIELVTLNDDGSALLRLRHVRVSFPHLFSKWKAPNASLDSKPKYKLSLLLPKGSDNFLNAKKAYDHCVKIGMKGIAPRNEDKRFLRSCDAKAQEGREGYVEGDFYISASSDNKPRVVDNKKVNGGWRDIAEDEGRIYGGCYVNATLTIKPSKGTFGAACAYIQAVQFAEDGTPFGAGNVNVNNEFEDIEDSGSTEDMI